MRGRRLPVASCASRCSEGIPPLVATDLRATLSSDASDAGAAWTAALAAQVVDRLNADPEPGGQLGQRQGKLEGFVVVLHASQGHEALQGAPKALEGISASPGAPTTWDLSVRSLDRGTCTPSRLV